MSVTLIDYGAGNLHSAEKAFRHVTSMEVQVTNKASEVAKAERVVLPGVGAFADCMQGLCALDGMLDALHETVMVRKRPFLGICVGMQMMLERGLEHGNHAGLGWIKGQVEAITVQAGLKIPHMGWNDLQLKRPHALLENIQSGDHAYFVHSYHAVCTHAEDVLATVEYGQNITAVIARDNLMGTQFHPEKSQETGLKLIGNFLKV